MLIVFFIRVEYIRKKGAAEIHGKNVLQRLCWFFSQHYAKLSKWAGRSAARSFLSANLTFLLLASSCVSRWSAVNLLQEKGRKKIGRNNNKTCCASRRVNSSESEASRNGTWKNILSYHTLCNSYHPTPPIPPPPPPDSSTVTLTWVGREEGSPSLMLSSYPFISSCRFL